MTNANSDQRAAWNGESGQRWVASADRRDAVLAAVRDALHAHYDPDHGVMLEAAILLTTARTQP